jgi:hypothetical protein
MRLALAAAVAALLVAPSAAAKPPPTPGQLVERGLTAAVGAGRLDAGRAAEYRGVLARARAAVQTLPPLRAQLLEAVIGDVAAQSRRYSAPRALTLFSTLEVNIDWLEHHALAAPRPDVQGEDGAVYRFFEGHGYVFHPLANAAKLNSFAAARDADATAELSAALLARAVSSGPALLWEYEFPFASGRPPWTSGMAQAVLAQALARAAALLDDGSLRYAARRAYAAVAHLLSPSAPAKPWIALYSFDRAPVLNAQLQTAISLREYGELSGSAAVREFAEGLTAAAKTLLPRFDTGYWSLYSLHGGDSPLDYHEYVIGLLRRLTGLTGDTTWRETADRFAAYESQPPELKLGPPPPTLYPRPADDYRDRAPISFWLSKRSTVTLLIAGQRLTGTFNHGTNTLTWWAGKADPGVYHPVLVAVGPAGLRREQALEPLTVAPPPGPPSVDVEVTGPATLSWRSSAEGTPWLHLRVRLSKGAEQRVIDLGRRRLAGTRRLRLPPGRWHAALLATNSAGRSRFVSLGYLPR